MLGYHSNGLDDIVHRGSAHEVREAQSSYSRPAMVKPLIIHTHAIVNACYTSALLFLNIHGTFADGSGPSD